jgi:hypothetical protein
MDASCCDPSRLGQGWTGVQPQQAMARRVMLLNGEESSMDAPHTPSDTAEADILDAELHTDSRLRYIQRRMQEEEGLRLTIDNISYVLRLNVDYDKVHGTR